MSPITFEEALNATNPDDSQEQRETSARAIMAGVAANEVYWNHRPPLEALQAQADGHGVVSRGEEAATPTGVGSGTGTDPATIEGTATEEAPATAIDAAPAQSPTNDVPPASPDNPTQAVAQLRKQLEDAGMTPEA